MNSGFRENILIKKPNTRSVVINILFDNISSATCFHVHAITV